MTPITKHWPLAAALLGLYLAVAACLIVSLRQNEGRLIYALDDAYIHMAIAKNTATHGVWGVTPHGFSSSSSSILWPASLSLAYLAAGVNDVIPLALNLLAATALVVTAHVLLVRRSMPGKWIFVVLLGLVFATPLPFLVLTGMEHSLHVLLAVLFFFLAARFVANDTSSGQVFGPQGLFCCLLAALLTATRFEGLFMVASAAALLMMQRRVRHAAALTCAGVLPVLGYGLISWWRGWHFLPNSVLLKGARPSFDSFNAIVDSLGNTAYKATFARPEMALIVLAALIVLVALYFRDARPWNTDKALPWLLVLTTLLHLQFARTGGFFRYEAYLVACAVLGMAVVVHTAFARRAKLQAAWQGLPHLAAVGVLVVICMIPFGRRCAASLMLAPRAARNIYQQQYQMALFLKEYYEGQAVAVNDIGAIGYYADVELLDLAGLADVDVARARLDGTYNRELIGSLAQSRGVRIAIIHERWFLEHVGLPSTWRKVGEWEVEDNAVCADAIVSLFAVNPTEEGAMTGHFAKYSAILPEGVSWRARKSAPEPSLKR